MVKCLVCSEFEEAKRNAGNKQVYLADGAHYTGKNQQDIVDHLHGAPHAAAIEMKKLHSRWSASSSDHPWLGTLRSNDPNVIQTLTHMALDVYNNSNLLTFVGWSWPSRSLAQLHAVQESWK